MIRLSRFGIIHSALVLFAAALILRAGYVQIWQGAKWEQQATRQHYEQDTLPAPRGDILDASGSPLVESRARVRLAINPRQVKSPAKVAQGLERLGVPASFRRRASDRKLKWVDIPGRFLAVDAEAVSNLVGVYVTPTMERTTNASPGMLNLVGRVDGAGVAVDGLERSLDHHLRGERGSALMPRDRRGKIMRSVAVTHDDARAGNSVVLTLDRRLQDIAEGALKQAVIDQGARGGDIVVLDPNTGEIRAVASYHADGRYATSAALTVPFEPGSTIKPLLVSRLLEMERARPDETIETYNGSYEINGRTITDDHPAPQLTLSQVVAQSSNIGMVRFSERLAPGEQYEALRDFGFGMPTGLPFATESSGLLRTPKQWSKMSAASLAMGYELTVTSVQLATAYASIANGGQLIEPALVKEIRSPEGNTLYRHQPRIVRRVMDEKVAVQVREMLVGVVESGTAQDAITEAGRFAGKTGTARLRLAGRGYTVSEHLASFVGMFPADKPQLVILVKLVNPRESYGGRTAAPVSKQVIEAAIAVRSIALGRPSAATSPVAIGESVPAETTVAVDMPEEAGDVGSPAYVISLDSPSVAVRPRPDPRPVPNVSGMPLRSAVYTLHRAGFRVRLAGNGRGTTPAPGTLRRPGTFVDLFNIP